MSGIKGMGKGHTRNLKGGWVYLQRHGKPPKDKRHVARYMEAVRHSLLEVLGGINKATPQEVLLIDTTSITAGIVALMWEHIAREGAFLGQSNEIQPCLKTLGSYLNTLRLNVCSLGIDRRAGEEILDLPSHLAKHYPAQAAEVEDADGK